MVNLNIRIPSFIDSNDIKFPPSKMKARNFQPTTTLTWQVR